MPVGDAGAAPSPAPHRTRERSPSRPTLVVTSRAGASGAPVGAPAFAAQLTELMQELEPEHAAALADVLDAHSLAEFGGDVTVTPWGAGPSLE